MTIDPDFDGRDVAEEDITSGNMLFIDMMLRVATGDDSGMFWKEFQNHFGAAAD